MANYLEFYLIDEENDNEVLKKVSINFLFIDYLLKVMKKRIQFLIQSDLFIIN